MKKLFIALALFSPALFYAQNTGDYRTVNSGDWFTTSVWERYDGANWAPPSVSPNSSDGVITISAGNTIAINGSISIDQTIVESGATLNWNAGVLSINNGSGVDLDVQGIITDNSTNSISFSSGATWQLGNLATIVRTQNNGSNPWQDNYQGGISTIPADSYWILRKTGASTPSITTIGVNGGAYYGNLILENTSGGVWNSTASSFSGSNGFPTIKSNFDIGGDNSNTPITFLNTNTNATPATILGNLLVRSTHTLSNSTGGRGFEVRGNVEIDGTLDNDGGSSGFGLLRLAGSNNQTISGSGTILIREMVMNKPSNSAELLRDLSPNNLTLTNGNLTLNVNVLTIPSSGTISGGSATSYVNTNSTGVLRRTVGGVSTLFPVGKGSYNPLVMSNSGTSDQFDARVFDEVWSNGEEGSGSLITSNVVGRTWLVEEITAGGSNVNMTVQWNLTDELSGFLRGNCYVSRHNGSGWDGDTPGPSTGAGPYTRSRSGITTLSPFAVASGGALPVELSRFDAQLRLSRVHLSWSTATETDNSHFVVERGADGRTFAEIGRVNGAGTVREKQEYVFTDEKPLAGANYYRLRQVDFDGQFSFSPVRRVVAGQAAGALTLLPNPAGAILQVQMAEAAETDGSWEIFDTGGKQLAAGVFPAENDIAPVYVGDLPVGIYCLRLINGPNSWQKTFIKQ